MGGEGGRKGEGELISARENRLSRIENGLGIKSDDLRLVCWIRTRPRVQRSTSTECPSSRRLQETNTGVSPKSFQVPVAVVVAVVHVVRPAPVIRTLRRNIHGNVRTAPRTFHS